MPFGRVFSGVALSLLFALPATSTARAWERASTETGALLFWPTRRIVLRPLADPAGVLPEPAVAATLDLSAREWSGASCSDLTLVREGTAGGSTTNLDGGAHDGENRVVIRRSGWPPELTSTIALTTSAYLTRTGELLDSDVDLNGVDHDFFAGAGSPPPTAVDLRNTLTHELGHAIGLAHSTDPSATMFGRSTPGEIDKRDLAPDDLDALCTVYPRGAPTPTEPRSRTLGCGCRAGGAREWPTLGGVILALGFFAARRRGLRRDCGLMLSPAPVVRNRVPGMTLRGARGWRSPIALCEKTVS